MVGRNALTDLTRDSDSIPRRASLVDWTMDSVARRSLSHVWRNGASLAFPIIGRVEVSSFRAIHRLA